MKIGIDARLYRQSGVGRYIRNLIYNLSILDNKNEYVIFLPKSEGSKYELPNRRWQKRIIDLPWHSLREQIYLPGILAKEHLDLVHFPYFNTPIFYQGKFVLTIHDLIIDHFGTGKASTLPLPFYLVRKLGYKLALWFGLTRSCLVITVSNTTKKEIADHYSIPADKIQVTYEGVDWELKPASTLISSLRLLADPYFLYVGNAYPHKNLENLITAFDRIKRASSDLKLVLVGEKDFFYQKLAQQIKNMNLTQKVILFGRAENAELVNLYRNAIALVQPSLMEGFGLPPLEAISNKCPILVSDIPIFREILGDLAMYFDPRSVADITAKLERILILPKTQTYHEPDKSFWDKFNWSRLAAQTLKIYESCFSL